MTPSDDGPRMWEAGDRVIFQWSLVKDTQDIGTVVLEEEWGIKFPKNGGYEDPILVHFDGDKTPEWVESASLDSLGSSEHPC